MSACLSLGILNLVIDLELVGEAAVADPSEQEEHPDKMEEVDDGAPEGEQSGVEEAEEKRVEETGIATGAGHDGEHVEGVRAVAGTEGVGGAAGGKETTECSGVDSGLAIGSKHRNDSVASIVDNGLNSGSVGRGDGRAGVDGISSAGDRSGASGDESAADVLESQGCSCADGLATSAGSVRSVQHRAEIGLPAFKSEKRDSNGNTEGLDTGLVRNGDPLSDALLVKSSQTPPDTRTDGLEHDHSENESGVGSDHLAQIQTGGRVGAIDFESTNNAPPDEDVGDKDGHAAVDESDAFRPGVASETLLAGALDLEKHTSDQSGNENDQRLDDTHVVDAQTISATETKVVEQDNVEGHPKERTEIGKDGHRNRQSNITLVKESESVRCGAAGAGSGQDETQDKDGVELGDGDPRDVFGTVAFGVGTVVDLVAVDSLSLRSVFIKTLSVGACHLILGTLRVQPILAACITTTAWVSRNVLENVVLRNVSAKRVPGSVPSRDVSGTDRSFQQTFVRGIPVVLPVKATAQGVVIQEGVLEDQSADKTIQWHHDELAEGSEDKRSLVVGHDVFELIEIDIHADAETNEESEHNNDGLIMAFFTHAPGVAGACHDTSRIYCADLSLLDSVEYDGGEDDLEDEYRHGTGILPRLGALETDRVGHSL